MSRWETNSAPSAFVGYTLGQRVAKYTSVALVLVGIMEIGVGSFSNSISLVADGIDSFSDATIAFIIWFGLRLSLKQPTRYFHYGYLKVESLVAFGASIGMIGVASLIAYRAYLSLLNPHVIRFPAYALIALVIAASISLYYAVQMRRIAKKHGLTSLQIGAANSIKDTSASFVVLGSVTLSSFGIVWMDPIGALIVAIYIYSIAYVAIKESSLILLDSCNSPEVVDRVRALVKSISEVSDVPEIKLRRSGPFLSGRVKITLDSTISLTEANEIVERVESTLFKELGPLREFVVIPVPHRKPD